MKNRLTHFDKYQKQQFIINRVLNIKEIEGELEFSLFSTLL